MKIEWPAKKSFIEGVHYGFEYVLLDPKCKPLHAPVQCKDFLTDAFWSEATGKPASIYGFTWKPGTLDPKAETFRIALKYKDESMAARKGALQAFLSILEGGLGYMPKSTVRLDESKKILVVTFPRAWTVKPVLVSAFLLFLRMGCVYDGTVVKPWVRKFAEGKITPLAAVDTAYVKQAQDRINDFLDGKAMFTQTYAQYTQDRIGDLHSRSGIVNWKEGKQG